MSRKRIAIVGAGPAGLVAALAANKLGFDVRVFEQAPDFAKLGGGIMIHSNGQRVLDALSLLLSFEPQIVFVSNGLIQGVGERLLTKPDFSELDVPFNRVAVVWRYQLQEHLLKAAYESRIRVNFDHRLENLEVRDGGARLVFENGADAEADIVICADGVNSRTRAAAKFDFEKIEIGEGWIRGSSEVVISTENFREIWGDDGRRFGIAPLIGGKTYFYARVPVGEWEDIRQNRLNEWIDGWKAFGDGTMKTLQGVTEWEKINYSELFEIHAREWAKGPVFLVGDAAHAMTPNVGQGANSAMVDPLFLSLILKRSGGENLTEVGREYTNLRHRFVTRTQTAARRSGALAAGKSAFSHFMRDGLLAVSRRSRILPEAEPAFDGRMEPVGK